MPTPFDRAPMMVRAGSIIPLAPVMQYAEEKKWDDLEIVVYPGEDGTFTLYEDEGDNYNYEQGVYSTIDFRWNNRRKELTIANREGKFPGMLTNRTFRVRLADSRSTKTIAYDGSEQTIKL